MCMWQSQALAGALSLGAAVPEEFGTGCCGRPDCGSNAPVVLKTAIPRSSRKSAHCRIWAAFQKRTEVYTIRHRD